MKPAHRLGYHGARASTLRLQRWRADPATRCWRCGNTIHNCRPMKDGRPSWWTNGHLRDGDPTSPIEPECSRCNLEAGGKLTGQRAGVTKATRDWTQT